MPGKVLFPIANIKIAGRSLRMLQIIFGSLDYFAFSGSSIIFGRLSGSDSIRTYINSVHCVFNYRNRKDCCWVISYSSKKTRITNIVLRLVHSRASKNRTIPGCIHNVISSQQYIYQEFTEDIFSSQRISVTI